MASKIKILLLDFTIFCIFSYIMLYIFEFIKPGIVSNYIDLNKLFLYIFGIIIFTTLVSQIKKIT